MYSTDIISTYSGHEQRNINWNAARGQVERGAWRETFADMQALIAFFRARPFQIKMGGEQLVFALRTGRIIA
jgi:uncharacterized protein (TIGR02217 family)